MYGIDFPTWYNGRLVFTSIAQSQTRKEKMGLLGCCCRCALCALLSQLMCVLIALGMIVAAYLAFEFYLKPWGEDQIAEAGDALDCDDCAGNDNEFPTTIYPPAEVC